MAGWAVQAIQLFAALSLLIILHEFGHFFFARLFKTRVEKFYLFFDFLFPFPGLLNFSLFKKKKGETQYGIGWFPMGGYVKIAGMVDESMDKDQMNKPPEPWEYRSKKAWQRLFIMLGGIIFNIITAMTIYAIVFGVWGEQYIPTEAVKYGVVPNEVAQDMGIIKGDKILSIGGVKVDRLSDIVSNIVLSSAKTIEVERNNQRIVLTIPSGSIGKLSKSKRDDFIIPRMPIVIEKVVPQSVADKMGLQIDDSLIAINGEKITYFDELDAAKQPLAGKTIELLVIRNDKQILLHGELPETKKLGFQNTTDIKRFFDIKVIKYSPLEALGKGFTYTFDRVGSYLASLKLLLTSSEIKASESVGGFVTFGKLFDPIFDWEHFLMLTALISVILAVMNLLPIPGLDGGYVIFLIFEMLTGKQVSDKVLGIANTIGLVLLLALMLYANGLDIMRLFQ